MYEIGVVAHFEAAHRLRGDYGPATRVHGHTYRLEVITRGERLQGDGTLYDLAKLQTAVHEIVADLHYHDLDEVPGFSGRNTTAEVVAEYIWERIALGLRSHGLYSLRVVAWENGQSYAARDDQL